MKHTDLIAKIMKLDSAEAMGMLLQIADACYITDCHVSGEHDPCHTEDRVCQIQMQQLAARVCVAMGMEETGDIPRKINREGWFKYYVENDTKDADGALRSEKLKDWEDNGVKRSAPLSKWAS